MSSSAERGWQVREGRDADAEVAERADERTSSLGVLQALGVRDPLGPWVAGRVAADRQDVARCPASA